MDRRRTVAAAAALALATYAAPGAVAAAAPAAAFAFPNLLDASQWKQLGYGTWTNGTTDKGKRVTFIFCATEPLPEASTVYRDFDADGPFATEHVTHTAGPAEARRLAKAWLHNALACNAERLQKGLKAKTKVVQHGSVQVEDGLRLAAVYFHTPARGYIKADDGMRLYAVGVDGGNVMTVEAWLDGKQKEAPIKQFRRLTSTGLRQMY